MSKGGGTQTTTTKSEIDPRVWSMLQGNYDRARSIADKPFTPYGGQLTAGSNTNLDAAYAKAGSLDSAGTGTLSDAIAGAKSASSFRPHSVTATSFDPSLGDVKPATGTSANAANIDRASVRDVNSQSGLGGLNDYLDPFLNDVVNASLSDLDQRYKRDLNANKAAATAAGAYGGSRHGVTDALTNEAYLREAGALDSQLKSAGFDRAANLMLADRARNSQNAQANQNTDLAIAEQNAGHDQQTRLFNAGAANDLSQYNAGLSSNASFANANILNAVREFLAGQNRSAQEANQNADLSAAGLNLNADRLLGDFAGQQFGDAKDAIGALTQTGLVQQKGDQQGLDALYNEYLRAQQYPFQTQALLNQALGLVPQGGTTKTTAPSQGGTDIGSLLSGAAAIASLFA